MTNPQLNAYLDVHCFGMDQSQKMCGAGDYPDECIEQHYNDEQMRTHGCSVMSRGTRWANCPHRKPYTPPDYCADWAAFGRLVEWLDANGGEYTLGRDKGDPEAVATVYTIQTKPNRYTTQLANTLPLALARAVYEATKGNQ